MLINAKLDKNDSKVITCVDKFQFICECVVFILECSKTTQIKHINYFVLVKTVFGKKNKLKIGIVMGYETMGWVIKTGK